MASSHMQPQGYLSAIDAGKQFGYTNDYVARLARERKIEGIQEGRQWFVDTRSLEEFIKKTEEAKREQSEKVRAERRKERHSHKGSQGKEALIVVLPKRAEIPVVGLPGRPTTLAKAGLVLSVGVLAGSLFFNALTGGFSQVPATSASAMDALRAFAARFYNVAGEHSLPSEGQDKALGDSGHSPQTGAASEGIVVLAPGDTTTHEEVQNSFSDETEVVMDESGTSGLIKPIFKSGADTAYRFLLVPLKSSEGGQ